MPKGPRGTRRAKRQAYAIGGLALLFLVAVPNNPTHAWLRPLSVVPEIVCGWFQSDEDQWRCDMEPMR